MCQNTIFTFLFLTYFTLYNRFQVHSPHQNRLKGIHFYGRVIFRCVHVPLFLYPFICQWTSMLLPCSSYCKQCCNGQWDTCAFFSFGFLRVYAQQWDCWIIWSFYSILSSIVAVSIHIPTRSERFLFLHTLSSTCCLWVV